jgi:flavin-binding protein dodecin
MDARTYKLIDLVGVSDESYSEATKNAIARASETLRGLGWFEVVGSSRMAGFPSTR